MPVPFALPVGFLLGLSLAWLARAELARSDVPLVLARPFLVTLSLAFLVYAPAIGYFAMYHSDWAYLYAIRSSRIPSAIDLVLVIASGAMLPVGFAVTAPWAIAKRSERVLQTTAALGSIVVVLAIVLSRRLVTSASYTQWAGGFGLLPIGKSPLGRGVLASWMAVGIAYAVTAYGLRGPRLPR